MQVTVVNESKGESIVVDFPCIPLTGDVISWKGESKVVESRWFRIKEHSCLEPTVTVSILI